MSDWKQFLDSQVAMTGKNGHAGVDPQAAGAVIDLSHLALLDLSGPDTQTFLQGQLTNDVRQVTPQLGQLAGWCTAKGRLLTTFVVYQQDNAYRLLLPRPLSPAIAKRLTMYILRAKVKVTDITDDQVRLGFHGAATEAVLAARFGQLPQQSYATIRNDFGTLLRLPGERYLALVSEAQAIALATEVIANGAVFAGLDAWEGPAILAGEPEIRLETQEEFVPQQVNLDLIGAVNFKKGCYPGQEIVARTHYLGRIKRRMYRLAGRPAQMPAPGSEIHTRIDEALHACGKVVRSALLPDGQMTLLAVLQQEREHEVSAEDTFFLADGSALQLCTLPYSVDATGS